MMRLLPPSLWLGGSVFPGASRFLALSGAPPSPWCTEG